MDTLYIIIPSYNEEANIEKTVKAWHTVAEKIGGDSRLIMIDDGSEDSTRPKLHALSDVFPFLRVLEKENSGHGGTILFGYQYAVEKNATYIFQTDSDGQTDAKEFWRLWQERKKYDAQFGLRKGREDGMSRVFVSWVLKQVLFFSFGVKIKDANVPFRLMSRKSLSVFLPEIPKDYNLSNVLVSVLYAKSKASVRFEPITFRPRQGGKNSINLRKICKIGRKAVRDFRVLKKTII